MSSLVLLRLLDASDCSHDVGRGHCSAHERKAPVATCVIAQVILNFIKHFDSSLAPRAAGGLFQESNIFMYVHESGGAGRDRTGGHEEAKGQSGAAGGLTASSILVARMFIVPRTHQLSCGCPPQQP